MMHFRDPAADGPWLSELKESGLVTPDVIERIDASIGRPESGTLNGFLLAGADHIAEDAWIDWMIRRHGCHRFGQVRWREEAAHILPDSMPAEGNLPYRTCEDESWLAALLRPDLKDSTLESFGSLRLRWAAATLREIRELHAAWGSRINCGPTEAGPRSSRGSRPGIPRTSFPD